MAAREALLGRARLAAGAGNLERGEALTATDPMTPVPEPDGGRKETPVFRPVNADAERRQPRSLASAGRRIADSRVPIPMSDSPIRRPA